MHEFLVLRFGTESHHAFHSRAVVPTAVKQHHLARGGKMGGVALEIPLSLLALGGSAQSYHAADARVQLLRDALDRATLSGSVAAFEQDHDFQTAVANPFVKLHEFDL